MKLDEEQERILFRSVAGTDTDRTRDMLALLQSLQLSAGPEAATFARNYIEDAIAGRNADDLEKGLILAFWFGFACETAGPLRLVIGENWHHRHEDVVWALDHELRDDDNVEALYQATQIVPEYLEFDEARALAVKAIWVLGNLGNATAQSKLIELARSSNEVIRRSAIQRLERIRPGR